jgi:hypothetical protein
MYFGNFIENLLFLPKRCQERFDIIAADDVFGRRIPVDMDGGSDPFAVVDFSGEEMVHIGREGAHDVDNPFDFLTMDVLILHDIHDIHDGIAAVLEHFEDPV